MIRLDLHRLCSDHSDVIFFISQNGEEFFNKLLSPDPDANHLRGGPSHGHTRPTPCVNKFMLIGAICFELHARTDRQTNRQAKRPSSTTLALPSGSDGNNSINHENNLND